AVRQRTVVRISTTPPGEPSRDQDTDPRQANSIDAPRTARRGQFVLWAKSRARHDKPSTARKCVRKKLGLARALRWGVGRAVAPGDRSIRQAIMPAASLEQKSTSMGQRLLKTRDSNSLRVSAFSRKAPRMALVVHRLSELRMPRRVMHVCDA